MYAIMIVEDEELIRQGLTSLVDYEQFGMTVINQAENGREAWEKFQDQPADILLTDINMPQMNGLDLAHLVKEQSPSCHIIFLTGYDDFEFARKAIKLGADDYLLKPFSKDDIEEMLAKVKGGTGGLGDQGFNDIAYEGLKRAEEELGIELEYAEPQVCFQ